MSSQHGSAEALALFKERHGAASDALLAWVKDSARRKSAIRKALAAGPLTVPDVASAVGISPAEALWLLTAMRKYGLITEHSVEGDYVRYALPEKEVQR
jgi:hypothetical protein